MDKLAEQVALAKASPSARRTRGPVPRWFITGPSGRRREKCYVQPVPSSPNAARNLRDEAEGHRRRRQDAHGGERGERARGREAQDGDEAQEGPPSGGPDRRRRNCCDGPCELVRRCGREGRRGRHEAEESAADEREDLWVLCGPGLVAVVWPRG